MSFPQFGIAYPPPSVSTSTPQVLMSTASPPSTTSAGSTTPCCDTGRPIMTDPHTGQTICSCQYTPTGGLLTYPRVPGLPEGLYGSPYAAAAAQTFMPLADPSAFYPAGTFDLKGLATSPMYAAYDPLAGYPYNGFLDPNARRKNATRESTQTLKAWLAEHKKNPYPTKGEKIMLAIITKMTLTQVSTWFANARRRLKKENKMTWEPRNRVDDEDDDDKLADSDAEDGGVGDGRDEDRDDLEIDIGTESDDELPKDHLSDSRRLMEQLAARSMASAQAQQHLQSLVAAQAQANTSSVISSVGSIPHNPFPRPGPMPGMLGIPQATSSPSSSATSPVGGPSSTDNRVGMPPAPSHTDSRPQGSPACSDISDSGHMKERRDRSRSPLSRSSDTRRSPSPLHSPSTAPTSSPPQSSSVPSSVHPKPKIWSMVDIATSSSSHRSSSPSPSSRPRSPLRGLPQPPSFRGASTGPLPGFPAGISYAWPPPGAGGLPHPYALPHHLMPVTSMAGAAAALQQATSTAAILSRYGLGTSSAFSRPPQPTAMVVGPHPHPVAGLGENRELPAGLKPANLSPGEREAPGRAPATLHTAFRPVPKSKPTPIHV